jgi:predicted alpha/beta-hydrolase family hydrolase
MRNGMVVLGIVVLALAALAAFGQDKAGPADVEIDTARGVKIKAALYKPKAGNGAAVVIAPGKGFPAKTPLLTTCAERLAEAGFSVVKFDYGYYALKGGEPNYETFAPEFDDLESAVGYAKKLDGVSKVILAGKSMGSALAVDWAKRHPNDLAGLALLTWVVNGPEKRDEMLPQATELFECPYAALVVNGADDDTSNPRVLYEAAAKCKAPPLIVIVPGDHGLMPKSKDAAETAENCELAARAFVVWAKRKVSAK